MPFVHGMKSFPVSPNGCEILVATRQCRNLK
jgi:hypothetical protein